VQVSFDEYLQDRARVFRAMFPDESRSQRVGDVRNHHLTRTLLSISSASSPGETYRFWVLQGEWRVQMLPLQFLLLTVRPVVVMQLLHRAGGLDLRVVRIA
jgi:hypothetical protein